MTTDAPATGTEPLHNDPTTTSADHQDPPDTGAELDRWKQTSRKWEDRAKQNAKAAEELATLKTASMSELERAVNEAKTSARAEALREVGADRARDAVRVALAGRSLDIDALLEGFGAEAFVQDDGTPDVERIRKWADRLAPAGEPVAPGVPRVPTGPRSPTTPASDPAREFADFLSAQRKPR